jgi:hypothetical protein
MRGESVSTEERGANVYSITLPPGFLLCTNSLGAMRLLNRSRTAVWSYVQQGILRGFNVAGNVVVPLVDIANLMGVSESQVYNAALVYDLPIWQVKVDEGG